MSGRSVIIFELPRRRVCSCNLLALKNFGPGANIWHGGCLSGWQMNLVHTKAKILLADDDDEVLAALGSVLTSEGHEVIVARNGREAIENFRQQHIDVALLDLNMPVKGGWEAFERLMTIHPLLQVIVITARPDQYPLAIAAGVAALMEKPLDLPVLLQTIDDLLVEPVENRLSRLAGRRPITKYLGPDI
jgi:CheY-like chemotaxis protein